MKAILSLRRFSTVVSVPHASMNTFPFVGGECARFAYQRDSGFDQTARLQYTRLRCCEQLKSAQTVGVIPRSHLPLSVVLWAFGILSGAVNGRMYRSLRLDVSTQSSSDQPARLFTWCHRLLSSVIHLAATFAAALIFATCWTLVSPSATGILLVPPAVFAFFATTAPRAKEEKIATVPVFARAPRSFEANRNQHTNAAAAATVATLNIVVTRHCRVL